MSQVPTAPNWYPPPQVEPAATPAPRKARRGEAWAPGKAFATKVREVVEPLDARYGSGRKCFELLYTLNSWATPKAAQPGSLSGPIAVSAKRMAEGFTTRGITHHKMSPEASPLYHYKWTDKQVARYRQILLLLGVLTPGNMRFAATSYASETRIQNLPLVVELNPLWSLNKATKKQFVAVFDAVVTAGRPQLRGNNVGERPERAEAAIEAIRTLPVEWFGTVERREALIAWSFLGRTPDAPAAPFPAADCQFDSEMGADDGKTVKEWLANPGIELPTHLAALPGSVLSTLAASHTNRRVSPAGEEGDGGRGQTGSPTRNATQDTAAMTLTQTDVLPGFTPTPQPETVTKPEPKPRKKSDRLDDVTAPVFKQVSAWRFTTPGLPPTKGRGRWCAAVGDWMKIQRRDNTAWGQLAETRPDEAAQQLQQWLEADLRKPEPYDVQSAASVEIARRNFQRRPTRRNSAPQGAAMDAATANRATTLHDPCRLTEQGISADQAALFYRTTQNMVMIHPPAARPALLSQMAEVFVASGELPSYDDPRWH